MNARKPRQEQEPTSQPASLPGTSYWHRLQRGTPLRLSHLMIKCQRVKRESSEGNHCIKFTSCCKWIVISKEVFSYEQRTDVMSWIERDSICSCFVLFVVVCFYCQSHASICLYVQLTPACKTFSIGISSTELLSHLSVLSLEVDSVIMKRC